MIDYNLELKKKRGKKVFVCYVLRLIYAVVKVVVCLPLPLLDWLFRVFMRCSLMLDVWSCTAQWLECGLTLPGLVAHILER